MKLAILGLCLALTLTSALAASASQSNRQIFDLEVTEKGFVPSSLHAKTNIPVILKITRKTDATCATEISIPEKKLKVDLPLNKTVEIKLGKLKKGELRFACGMNMISGVILIEE